MPRRDFLGQPLTVGDFVAAGVVGNTRAEYGMILHEVTAVETKLKLRRLKVTYKGNAPPEIGWYGTTVKNPNKYVKVYPPDSVRVLFHRAIKGELREGEPQMIAKWVHGTSRSANLPGTE